MARSRRFARTWCATPGRIVTSTFAPASSSARTTPLAQTIRETLAWAQETPPVNPEVGLTPEREAALLDIPTGCGASPAAAKYSRPSARIIRSRPSTPAISPSGHWRWYYYSTSAGQRSGTFNVTSAIYPLGELLEAAKRETGSDARFTYVSEEFLLEQEVGAWPARSAPEWSLSRNRSHLSVGFLDASRNR